jgi:hypothetical protein
MSEDGLGGHGSKTQNLMGGNKMAKLEEQKIALQPVSIKIVEAEEKSIALLVKKAEALQVHNQDTYEIAGNLRVEIKTKIATLEKTRKSATVPLDNAKAIIMSWFKPLGERLAGADSILEKGRLVYVREQERIRLEQEEKLRKAAEAEEARKRKIKEEQEAAWREKEEAARKEAERLEKAGKEAEAAKAREEQERAAEKAKERAQEAAEVQVVAPVLASTVEKTAGISGRKNWKFEIIDENAIPRKYLQPNLVQIGKEVRAAGDTLSIPGIRIYPDEKEVVRTK